MLVVGDREAETGEVAVREHREGDTGAEAVDGPGRAAVRRVAPDSA